MFKDEHEVESSGKGWTEQQGITDGGWVIHAMRHTFASRLVRKGIDLYTVKELLGHSTITVTERYAHLNPPNCKRAWRSLMFGTSRKKHQVAETISHEIPG